jgi:hypothetical protein
MIKYIFAIFIKHSFKDKRKGMHEGLDSKKCFTFRNVFVDPVNNQPLIDLIYEMVFYLFDKDFIYVNGSDFQSLLILVASYQLFKCLSFITDNAGSADCRRRRKI